MMEVKWEDPNRAMDKLLALPNKLKKKVMRSAMRKAVNIWRDAARATARGFDDPETPLNISKHITTGEDRKLGRKEGGIAMRVGVRGGARSQKGEPTTPWYWRFKEFGTQKQQAEPFMRPAQQNNIQAATDTLAREVSSGIDKVIRESP